MRKVHKTYGLMLLAAAGTFNSCIKVPADVDFLSSQANYTQTVYEPVLGRTSLFPDETGAMLFNPDNSTLPLSFKIVNFRDSKGDSAEIFSKTFPTIVWKEAYTGEEKTREEVEKKRRTEDHKLFEVREHSGQFVMWAPTNLSYLNAIKMQPDNGYTFDVEVSNSGGSKMIRNMQLKPLRPRPYEPSATDPITGNMLGNTTVLTLTRMYDKFTSIPLNTSDVAVVFYKEPESTRNALSFEFRDTAYRVIDPMKFGVTKWEELVHHFGTAKFENNRVVFDVAYPIPLAKRATKYTNFNGTRAKLEFGFDRIMNGMDRVQARMTFEFAIYEPGDWKMVFWFRGANPDFSDN